MPGIYDLIRLVTLVAGFGYFSCQEKKTWLMADSVFIGCYAVGLYLFPGTLYPEGGPMFAYVTRSFAAMLTLQLSMMLLTRQSRDETVHASILWSRVLSCMTLLMVMAYGYTHHPDLFSQRNIWFDFPGFVLLLLSSVYQLFKGDYAAGSREQKGPVSVILRLMFLVAFFYGLLDLTFTKWVGPFKNVEKYDVLVIRGTGALLIGMTPLPWYATSYRHDEDRTAFFIATSLMNVLLFLPLLSDYFLYGVFSAQESLIVHGSMALPILLSGLGFYLSRRNGASKVESSYYTRSKSN